MTFGGLLLLVAMVSCTTALQVQEPISGLLLAHPQSCSAYYQFVPQLKYCPRGLAFNPKLQTCDWPANRDCSCIGSGGKNVGTGGNIGGTGDQEEDCPTREKCPAVDSEGHPVYLPHLTDCNLLCRCEKGIPKLDRCPTGLHFNPRLQVCKVPDSGTCSIGVCQSLSNNDRGHWEPTSCVENSGEVGDKCQLICNSEYQLSGSSEITCTETGWGGVTGVNRIPSCKSVEETGEDFIDKIHDALQETANFLFVLDESGSVRISNFAFELSFVKAIVRAYPLSVDRSAGVITFDHQSAVDISIKESNTCTFFNGLDAIKFNGGGTDILDCLNRAYDEIVKNAVHNRTLVFLVTDGRSSTDPTEGANKIKNRGDILFTVGVGGIDEKQLAPLSSLDENGYPLFYPIRDFGMFNDFTAYLTTKYNGTKIEC